MHQWAGDSHPLLHLKAKVEIVKNRLLMRVQNNCDIQTTNILLNLVSDSYSWCLQLLDATLQHNVSLAAYCARNILELWVWTTYCIKSPGNANDFVQDAMKDINGLLIPIRRLASLAGPDSTKSWSPETWAALSTIDSMGKLKTDFIPVSEAANTIGKEDGAIFSILNKVFSKFAHPTALVVSGIMNEELSKPITTFCLRSE